MRVGLIPQSFLERISLSSNVGPTPILLAVWGLGACRTMMAGVRLGIFDALSRDKGGDRSAEELARQLGYDPAGTETLLDALVGFGHLSRRDGRYQNGKVAEKWFTANSKSSLHNMVLFLYHVWDFMNSLEEAVRGGKSHVRDLHDPERPPEFWEHYLRGLAEFARLQGWEMVRRVPLPKNAKSLLDVGGGHGMFSVAFCRYHEGLAADVLDFPPAAAVGRSVVAEERMDHRVRFIEGDLRHTDFGQDRDAILLFILVHHFSPEEVQRILARAFAALRPGGTIAIFEPEHRGGSDDVTQSGGMMELMFFLTSRARAYREETLRGWLEKAKFDRIRTTRLLTAPMTVLLTARRPEHA
ncbi:methyltransferase domain-containing protein [Pendulispora brunnea]|uniref:Methyltransferase domain-containing protein n=1 Tax=Pendulispora brunnea TaxID=2905690 RepID=A0ABZ2K248_9BACT